MLLIAEKVTLIDSQEASESNVSRKEAEEFLRVTAVKKAPTKKAAAKKEEDDMVLTASITHHFIFATFNIVCLVVHSFRKCSPKPAPSFDVLSASRPSAYRT